MSKKINIEDYMTIQEYADANNIFRQRVYQLIDDGRLSCIDVLGKKLIKKTDKIKPSKHILGRPKKVLMPGKK